MKSNIYLEDDELRGWLMAWSMLMIVGGFVLGVMATYAM